MPRLEILVLFIQILVIAHLTAFAYIHEKSICQFALNQYIVAPLKTVSNEHLKPDCLKC